MTTHGIRAYHIGDGSREAEAQMDWRPVLIGTAVSAMVMAISLAAAFAIVADTSADRLEPRASRVSPGWSAHHAYPDEAWPNPVSPGEALVEKPEAPQAAPASATAASATRPVAVRHPVRGEAVRVHSRRREGLAERTDARAPPARPEVRIHASPPVSVAMAAGRDPGPGQVQGAAMVTPALLRRLHSALRLSPEQEPLWAPVERALREIGIRQAAIFRAGQDPREVFGFMTAMQMYAVARPLLAALREDQRVQARIQARNLGFTSVASQI